MNLRKHTTRSTVSPPLSYKVPPTIHRSMSSNANASPTLIGVQSSDEHSSDDNLGSIGVQSSDEHSSDDNLGSIRAESSDEYSSDDILSSLFNTKSKKSIEQSVLERTVKEVATVELKSTQHPTKQTYTILLNVYSSDTSHHRPQPKQKVSTNASNRLCFTDISNDRTPLTHVTPYSLLPLSDPMSRSNPIRERSKNERRNVAIAPPRHLDTVIESTECKQLYNSHNDSHYRSNPMSHLARSNTQKKPQQLHYNLMDKHQPLLKNPYDNGSQYDADTESHLNPTTQSNDTSNKRYNTDHEYSHGRRKFVKTNHGDTEYAYHDKY